MVNDVKWLMASDLHFPRHDKRKVDLFMKVMRWFKPDAVDYLGDIDDADSTGRWAAGPELMVGIGEGGVHATTQLFADTRAILPQADIHMHDGNHGWTRHKGYLMKNAPALLDVLDARNLYKYDQYGVHWHDYEKPPVHRFGDMYGHHGESISKNAGESVRNDVQGWDVSIIRGHSHRMGAYFKTFPLSGRMLRGFEIGHLCLESAMDYDSAPDWQAGFAIGHVVNDWPHIQLIQINDYTCVVDGKVFKN